MYDSHPHVCVDERSFHRQPHPNPLPAAACCVCEHMQPMKSALPLTPKDFLSRLFEVWAVLTIFNLSTENILGGREGTIIYNPNLLQWTSSYPTPAHTCACFTTFEESLCHHRGATYWLNTWFVGFIILPLSKEEEEKWPSMLTVIQCTLPPCLATVVVLKCWITWTMCNGSYRTSSYFTTLWRQFRDFSSSSSFTFFNIPHILLKHFCAGLHAPCIYTALLLHQKT